MNQKSLYLIAADALLLVHVLFVIFIIVGLLLTFIGKIRKWQWVRSPWFRSIHLVGINIVVLQSWLGMICPLTTWEMALREQAGAATYSGTFVSHWLSTLLYYQAPAWVFAAVYSAFAVLVVASWFWVRPHAFSGHKKN